MRLRISNHKCLGKSQELPPCQWFSSTFFSTQTFLPVKPITGCIEIMQSYFVFSHRMASIDLVFRCERSFIAPQKSTVAHWFFLGWIASSSLRNLRNIVQLKWLSNSEAASTLKLSYSDVMGTLTSSLTNDPEDPRSYMSLKKTWCVYFPDSFLPVPISVSTASWSMWSVEFFQSIHGEAENGLKSCLSFSSFLKGIFACGTTSETTLFSQKPSFPSPE